MAKLAVITGRKEHAARINEAWQQGIDAVVETGMRLEDAKGTLPHGEYEEMVRTDLNFSPQTALKLRAIASNRVLSNPAHVRDLPPSWGTLSELAVRRARDRTPRSCVAPGAESIRAGWTS